MQVCQYVLLDFGFVVMRCVSLAMASYQRLHFDMPERLELPKVSRLVSVAASKQ